MGKSWKTTYAAIATFTIAILSAGILMFDGDPTTNPDVGALVAAGTAAVGLLFARDNNVTSEAAGAVGE